MPTRSGSDYDHHSDYRSLAAADTAYYGYLRVRALEGALKIPDDIDIISELDKGDFVMLENPNLQFAKGKALLIDGHWVPKSQVRCDFDGNLYVADWLYGKEWE